MNLNFSLILTLICFIYENNIHSQVDCTQTPCVNGFPSIEISNDLFYPYKIRVANNSGGYNSPGLPIYANQNIYESNERITRVIILIHGNGGNAKGYYCIGNKLMNDHPEYSDNTLVIAPQFICPLHPADNYTGSISEDIIYWNCGRAYSNSSASGLDIDNNPTTDNIYKRSYLVRSYHVMDELIQHLSDPTLFPNVKTVVLIGQSSGGQFVGRYAIVNKVANIHLRNRDVHIRYVVMNPGTYAYLSDKRYEFENNNYLNESAQNENWISEIREINNPSSNCSTYDNWHRSIRNNLGSQRSNGLSREQLIQQFEKRDVTYLIGEKDNSNGGNNCDLIQGPNRLARTLLHYKHLIDLYGNDIRNYKKIKVVANVGHNGCATINSDEGIETIFAPNPYYSQSGYKDYDDLSTVYGTIRRFQTEVIGERPQIRVILDVEENHPNPAFTVYLDEENQFSINLIFETLKMAFVQQKRVRILYDGQDGGNWKRLYDVRVYK